MGDITVTLTNTNGQALTVAGTPDMSTGQWCKFQSFAGWYDPASVRTDQNNRPVNDSDFKPARSLRSGRVLTLVGTAEAGSFAAAELLWDQIAGLSPDGMDVNVQVATDNGIRQIDARIEGGGTVVPFHPRKATFGIPLYAHDARKRSLPRTSTVTLTGVQTGGLVFPLFAYGGGVVGQSSALLTYYGLSRPQAIVVTNAGSAPMYPSFTTTGVTQSGFIITQAETGNQVTYSSPTDGTPVTFSVATGRASIGVSDVSQNLSNIDDLSVPAYSTRTFVLTPVSNYTAPLVSAVTVEDAWW